MRFTRGWTALSNSSRAASSPAAAREARSSRSIASTCGTIGEVTVPDSLGRLRKVERIGSGGFASVWKYHDDQLDSAVAVKALADNWAQRLDMRDRFLEEARILRRAGSEHVISVHDIGEHDGTPYFVMTYADRGTVADLLDDPPGVGEVLDLVDQAAAGISVLHRQGIIHRDIKPQNLLLASTDDGGMRLLVADLGMAKADLQASGLTQVVGTPAYMAPEQATGVGLSTKADTFALAAVAYRLLTGHAVREGGLADVVSGASHTPPSQHGLPKQADAVFAKALAAAPGDRPTPAEFAAQLRAAYEPAQERSGSVMALLLAVLVFAAFFAAAYAATALLR
ncbi:MAG: serine/threonine protein kinase [Myxococcales bacterium]|nr:MAG: serine/threonine protein kinase [Myxococcales bacterium]